jgi:hypothetical protein
LILERKYLVKVKQRSCVSSCFLKEHLSGQSEAAKVEIIEKDRFRVYNFFQYEKSVGRKSLFFLLKYNLKRTLSDNSEATKPLKKTFSELNIIFC